ncbi:MAG TPA: methyltransferase [Candidatus Baltobacteraceae bacterium]|jgi:hypothetical protein|nr:methyltransferase [Candidatus Baltobacteraceae bacterium]
MRVRRKMLPPHYAAAELATMSWVSLAVAAFCDLQLPDALAGQARSAKDLSRLGYGNEQMLARLLRSLSAYDIVRAVRGGRFALGYAGQSLIGPKNAAAIVRYANASWHLNAYLHLANAVRSGTPGFDLAEGRSLFARLADDEESGRIFDAAMESLSTMFAQAFASAYDFSGVMHVVDVGGGTGTLLEAVLARFPNLHGTVVDVAPVVQRGRAIVRTDGIAARLGFHAADIFSEGPPAADAYIVSHVLHDWDDPACSAVLKNIARAMRPGARLLIYELIVVPEGNAWSQDRLSDIEMMAMLPGRERTRSEFATLLTSAGLQVRRVISTSAAESIIEATLATPLRD